MAVLAKIKKKIKGLIHKVQGNTSIIEALGVNPTASAAMRDAILLWSQMYENNADWLGESDDDDPIEVISLGLPTAIASEKARMATLELKSEITGNSEMAEFLNTNYQDGVIDKIRKQTEYAIAKGGIAITPYPVYENRDGKEQLHHFAFDFTQADRFIPISFDTSGNIVDAAFLIRKETQEYIYYRLERQTYQNGTVTITNRAFRKDAKSAIDSGDIYDVILGDEIQLSAVDEWANISREETYDNVDRVLFAYLKMPQANTIDTDSPLGVSGYSRAVDLIKAADIQQSRIDWEFGANLARIDIDQQAVRDRDGKKIDGLDRIPKIFRLRDTNDCNSYQVYAPSMRTDAYIQGLDELLTRIEDTCALSRGTLSHAAEEARTATELKILRQRTYSENADIQQAIQKALEDVVYIMAVYYSLIKKTKLKENEYDVSFEWDDSIIVDRETELQQRLTLMERGLAGRIENRMWYYGETEEQATEAIQKIDEENRKLSANRIEDY